MAQVHDPRHRQARRRLGTSDQAGRDLDQRGAVGGCPAHAVDAQVIARLFAHLPHDPAQEPGERMWPVEDLCELASKFQPKSPRRMCPSSCSKTASTIPGLAAPTSDSGRMIAGSACPTTTGTETRSERNKSTARAIPRWAAHRSLPLDPGSGRDCAAPASESPDRRERAGETQHQEAGNPGVE